MTDYVAEQEMELEALNAILMDEISGEALHKAERDLNTDWNSRLDPDKTSSTLVR